MSEGGTKRAMQRAMHKELLAKLTLLKPGPNDVFVLEVEPEYLENPEHLKSTQAFADEVQKHTGKDVYVMQKGYELKTVADPRTRPPDIAIPPPPQVHLPTGVRL